MSRHNIFQPVKHPDHLTDYFKKEWAVLLIVTLFGILYNVGLLAGPVFQGKLIDALIDEKDSSYVIYVALLFILAIIVVQTARYFKRFYVRRFANNTSACMRNTLYHSLLKKTERSLQEESMGSLMTKAISDVDACVEGMRKFTTEVFDTGIALISYVVAMLAIDVKMTVLSCIFIPVALFFAESLKKMICRLNADYKKCCGDVSEQTYEILSHELFYRVHGCEDANEEQYEKSLLRLEKSAVKANIWETSMVPVYHIIAMCGVFFVLLLSGTKIMNHMMTVGAFSTYLSIFTAMAAKASKTAKLFNSLQAASVSWKRMKPYFNEKGTEREISEKEILEKGILETEILAEKVSKKEISGSPSLKIQNLSFHYPGEKNNIIERLNLTAKAGMIIGVTGAVACGKTTLGRIFLGEYPYEGSILLNGQELSNLSQKERTGLISYMGHQPHLLSASIEENINLGDEKSVEKEIQTVDLTTDLLDMPQGIKTIIGNNGVRLSGGQQARIALARTLYHRTPVVILDDPFSAVDVQTESEIIQYLKRNMEDSIFLIISHRFTVFEKADQVILMNEDGSFTCGLHENLIRESEQYRHLFELQNMKKSKELNMEEKVQVIQEGREYE